MGIPDYQKVFDEDPRAIILIKLDLSELLEPRPYAVHVYLANSFIETMCALPPGQRLGVLLNIIKFLFKNMTSRFDVVMPGWLRWLWR
jgi:hypothetical protein